MYSILHYITKPKTSILYYTEKPTVRSAESTVPMFTHMLHLRWVPFLGVQRVCEPRTNQRYTSLTINGFLNVNHQHWRLTRNVLRLKEPLMWKISKHLPSKSHNSVRKSGLETKSNNSSRYQLTKLHKQNKDGVEYS